MVHALDQGDLRAHAADRLAHLHADRSPTQDQQPRGTSVIPVASRFVQTPSRSRRPSIGGMNGSEPVAITMCSAVFPGRPRHSIRPGNPGLAAEQVDAHALQPLHLAIVLVV